MNNQTTVPAGARYVKWFRDWHKVNPGATKTYCGRTIPKDQNAKEVWFLKLPPSGIYRCRVCFKPGG